MPWSRRSSAALNNDFSPPCCYTLPMRRRLLLLAGCALSGLVLFLLLTNREREPEYKGKMLSEWLLQYERQFRIDGYSAKAREAEDAVRHIGTNAVPCLVKWTRYERPRWKEKVSWARSRLPYWLETRLVKLFRDSAETRSKLAQTGFEI